MIGPTPAQPGILQTQHGVAPTHMRNAAPAGREWGAAMIRRHGPVVQAQQLHSQRLTRTHRKVSAAAAAVGAPPPAVRENF